MKDSNAVLSLTTIALAALCCCIPLHAGTVAYVSFNGGVQALRSGDTTTTQVVPNAGNLANGLALDAANNLYFANYQGRTIGKVTPDGTVSTFSSTNLNYLENGSTGLAMDASGNLYTAGIYNNRVTKIDTSGVASAHTDRDFNLNGPAGLAFDSHGNLFIADENGNTGFGQIEKVSPSGTVSVFATGLGGSGRDHYLFGLAIDSSDNIFASDPLYGQILKVTAGGTVSTFASGLGAPRGLAFDSAGNLFVVADQNFLSGGNNRILEICGWQQFLHLVRQL